ncbi:LOW QUALITY PROTEIN: Reverse transcriptase, partial [Phytophthora palmivora]
MCNWEPGDHIGRSRFVKPSEAVLLSPGEEFIVRIDCGPTNPQREVVWAGRGDRWVTQLIYAARLWPVAVRVVNVSDKNTWVNELSDVARIVEYGFFPRHGRFVRPGSAAYRDWEVLILESTPSPETKKRMEREARLEALIPQPPCVERPDYPWPTKVLQRPRLDNARVPFVKSDPTPVTKRVRFALDASTQTDDCCCSGVADSWDASGDTRDSETSSENVSPSDSGDDRISSGDSSSDSEPASPASGFQTSQLPADDLDLMDESWDIPVQGMPGTPVENLRVEYERCMQVSNEVLDLEPRVYMREGTELLAQLRDQLIFLGDGNAAPAPARGVICDLDVGDAKPVGQRPRSVAPHLMLKVYELLKKLLETGLIEYSNSPWASPIVIVLKKNGVDIRMCIDYRIVNSFIQLSPYPLPLIDDLLIGFEAAMWFISLDMAIGFWAIRVTERARLISAFTCPFGHFQWMPFGLKNAPLVYQAMLDNCRWGFVRLSPEEEAEVDADVLEFLQLKPPDSEKQSSDSENHALKSEMSALTSQMTVFQRNIPVPTYMGPVLGRSSYIDDIAHGAPTWGQLCDDLNALLFRLRYWNISVSLPKSEFGKLSIPYLSHEISAEGLRATPKIVKGVENLPFLSTLKGVQSFMGSLNYYNKFIEDLPVIAATLYELTDEQIRSGKDLACAREAFELLKRKIVSTPLLRHPDQTRPFVIIPHANPWAASAVLGQEYDGVIHPVRFTGRVLNDAELRYHIAEKEVIAILRVLENFRALVESSPVILVYTRYPVLKWLLTSNSTDGRNVKWGLKLSHWDLEIRRIQRDEDGLPAILGAGITPREHLDEVSENLIPAKGRVKPPAPVSVEMLEADYQGHVLSFDGAAKTSTRLGSCGCILWKLPGLNVLEALLKDVTVNDAEYCGLNYGLRMALEHGIHEL